MPFDKSPLRSGHACVCYIRTKGNVVMASDVANAQNVLYLLMTLVRMMMFNVEADSRLGGARGLLLPDGSSISQTLSAFCISVDDREFTHLSLFDEEAISTRRASCDLWPMSVHTLVPVHANLGFTERRGRRSICRLP